MVFSLLRLTSPMHVGSGADSHLADQPVIRDTRGLPFIPGGTLAGSFGALLDQKRRTQWLEPHNNNRPLPSPLVFNDAFPIPEQEEALCRPVEIRAQVTIRRDTITALEDHCFTMEVVPPGTLFRFFCRIDLESYSETTEFLSEMKRFLETANPMGGKVRSGTGHWEAEQWAYRILDLSNVSDLMLWLTKGHGYLWDGKWESLNNDFKIQPKKLGSTSRPAWKMTMDVSIQKGPHLLSAASGLPRKGAPDLRQARRMKIDPGGVLSDEPVDYGSALKGRLRTAMEMLLRTYLVRNIRTSPDKVRELLPVSPAEKPPWEKLADFFGYTGKKGRWGVKESPWEDWGEGREDHIRLCEFTQQAIKGAKFEFMPLCRGKSRVSVTLEGDAPEWQKELLANAGRLLALNILPWGGYGSRGYLGAEIQALGHDPYERGSLKRFLQEEKGKGIFENG